jgi:hypothetical protein
VWSRVGTRVPSTMSTASFAKRRLGWSTRSGPSWSIIRFRGRLGDAEQRGELAHRQVRAPLPRNKQHPVLQRKPSRPPLADRIHLLAAQRGHQIPEAARAQPGERGYPGRPRRRDHTSHIKIVSPVTSSNGTPLRARREFTCGFWNLTRLGGQRRNKGVDESVPLAAYGLSRRSSTAAQLTTRPRSAMPLSCQNERGLTGNRSAEGARGRTLAKTANAPVTPATT